MKFIIVLARIFHFTDIDSNKKTSEAISGLGPAVSATSKYGTLSARYFLCFGLKIIKQEYFIAFNVA